MRTSEHLHGKNFQSPPIKRSTFFQYELEHNNFPLSNEYVIAEDEMEDSPHKMFTDREKLPSFKKEDHSEKRGITSRERMDLKDKKW